MTRLQEAIGLGLVLGILHGLVQSAEAVPVVPNFTQETNDEAHGDNLQGDRDN